MDENDLRVEKISVSHTLRENAPQGRPGVNGEAFTSWSIKRADDRPMTIDEANLATMLMHTKIVSLALVDAVARGASDAATANAAKTAYIHEMEPIVKILREKVLLPLVKVEAGKPLEKEEQKKAVSGEQGKSERVRVAERDDAPPGLGEEVEVGKIVS